MRYVSGADYLPYGKYPRLFELWACTMIKTNDPCFDPETNTLHLGTTFREFLRLIGVQVGGRQLKSIKPQLERLFTTTELFDVTAARDHFDGTVDAGECRFCRYDARNREHHAWNAGTLF